MLLRFIGWALVVFTWANAIYAYWYYYTSPYVGTYTVTPFTIGIPVGLTIYMLSTRVKRK